MLLTLVMLLLLTSSTLSLPLKSSMLLLLLMSSTLLLLIMADTTADTTAGITAGIMEVMDFSPVIMVTIDPTFLSPFSTTPLYFVFSKTLYYSSLNKKNPRYFLAKSLLSFFLILGCLNDLF